MNLQSVRFHGAARRELRKAVDRYDEQVPGLGDEFAAEIELIAAHAESGTPHLAGTRRLQVRRFPYAPIYTARNEQLVVLAVAHHRRRPEYWLRRP
ncbi:MAG TPA: type II toxin-antitoxin system RelE/ParE family toxin [Longimicrobiaceae bacterium]|nr:type II toxin-antitoxin system RelE/ParE family toxin [Longimicrobiaceae bacterium]